MGKIIILRGLPASGKTTYAKNYIASHSNTFRINRDDIRAMLGCKWSREVENIVKDIEIKIAKSAILNGYDIIIDDTNISESAMNMWKEMASYTSARGQKYDFIIKDFFNVDVQECIRRDYIREKSVGKDVINKLNDKLQRILNKK